MYDLKESILCRYIQQYSIIVETLIRCGMAAGGGEGEAGDAVEDAHTNEPGSRNVNVPVYLVMPVYSWMYICVDLLDRAVQLSTRGVVCGVRKVGNFCVEHMKPRIVKRIVQMVCIRPAVHDGLTKSRCGER